MAPHASWPWEGRLGLFPGLHHTNLAVDSVPFPACRTASNQMDSQDETLESRRPHLTAARSACGEQQNQRCFCEKQSP